jgi:serine/threonine-protein kinase
MVKPWEERWLRDDADDIRGGQSVSFVARAKDGSGRRAFVKTLRRERVLQARRRFKREVMTYETVPDLGLPQLFDHNAERCEDGRTPMYMAIELIDGVNLEDRVEGDGPAAVDAALACVRQVGAVLTRCHGKGVIHRDIKPANIVLRGGDITTPILVDFGLSFNDDAEDGVTRVNEEVGNRFLRLPEHSRGGRSAVSDVTQLAGIFFYTLTGHEPRQLRDEFDRMPHQRPEPRSVLSDVLTQRQFLRLTTVFDRAFKNELLARYQTVSDLVTGLERAVRSDPEDDDNLQDMIDRVDELVDRHGLAASNEHRESLQKFMLEIFKIHNNVAHSRELRIHRGRSEIRVTVDEQWHENTSSIILPDQQPKAWTTFRIDRRGSDDYVVSIDGVEVWRGNAVDDVLAAAVQQAGIKQILAAYGEQS